MGLDAAWAVFHVANACESFGPLSMFGLTGVAAKTRDFRDALAKVRTRLPRDLVKLSLRDLLKLDLSHLPAAHANTINKSMNLLSAIVAHAIREGKMDQRAGSANPFQGIKLGIDDRENESRVALDRRT